MYINRYLESQVRETSKFYPVVMVCRQRQVGKSTMLNHMKAKSPNHADKNLSVLKKFKMDVQPGIILCMADEMLPFSRDVWYFPVTAI